MGNMSTDIPEWSPVKRFGDIMSALPVSSQVEDLVLRIWATVAVEARGKVLEPLPLGLFVFGVKLVVRVVRTIDQAQVAGILAGWRWRSSADAFVIPVHT